MERIDTIRAHTVEPGDYIEVNKNYLVVEQVEDNNHTVLIYGYSTLTGDREVESIGALNYVYLVTED